MYICRQRMFDGNHQELLASEEKQSSRWASDMHPRRQEVLPRAIIFAAYTTTRFLVPHELRKTGSASSRASITCLSGALAALELSTICTYMPRYVRTCPLSRGINVVVMTPLLFQSKGMAYYLQCVSRAGSIQTLAFDGSKCSRQRCSTQMHHASLRYRGPPPRVQTPQCEAWGTSGLSAAVAKSVERHRDVITSLLRTCFAHVTKDVLTAQEKLLLNIVLATGTPWSQRSDSTGTYLVEEGMKLWSVRPFAILATLVKSSLAVWMNPDPLLPQLRSHRR